MAEKEDTIESAVAPIELARDLLVRSVRGAFFAPTQVYGLLSVHQQAVMVGQGRVLGNNSALQAADAGDKADFFDRIVQGEKALPKMARWAANGTQVDDDYLRDRVRLGLWGTRRNNVEHQEIGDLFAAIEARHQALSHATPDYWSEPDKRWAASGLEMYLDRKLVTAGNAEKPLKARDVSFNDVATVFNSLSADAESLYQFASVEIARKSSPPEAKESLDDQQALIIKNAQNVKKYPSVRAVAQNTAVAVSAGSAVAMAVSTQWALHGGSLTAMVDNFVKHPPVALMGTVMEHASSMVDSLNTSVGHGVTLALVAFMATRAARFGTWIGAPATTLARLDEFVHRNPEKFTGMSRKQASWQQADYFLLTPFTNLSAHQMSDAQTLRFVEGMGHARQVVMADANNLPRPFPPSHWPQEVQDRLATWTTHEFVGLASIKEPTLANAYLFNTENQTDRLTVLDTQRRMSFLGSRPSPVRYDTDLLKKVREYELKQGDKLGRIMHEPGLFEGKVQKQVDRAGIDGQRLMSFLSTKDHVAQVATFATQPLDDANPTMDLIRRMNVRLINECHTVEKPNFAKRMAENMVIKKVLGLDEGKVQHVQQVAGALWSLVTDRIASKKINGTAPRQSFDFQHYGEVLTTTSGAAGAPVLLNSMPNWVKQRERAQAAYEADHPSLPVSRSTTVPPMPLPNMSRLAQRIDVKSTADAARIAEKLSNDSTFAREVKRNKITR